MSRNANGIYSKTAPRNFENFIFQKRIFLERRYYNRFQKGTHLGTFFFGHPVARRKEHKNLLRCYNVKIYLFSCLLVLTDNLSFQIMLFFFILDQPQGNIEGMGRVLFLLVNRFLFMITYQNFFHNKQQIVPGTILNRFLSAI